MLSVFSLSAALGVAFSAPSDALRQQSSAQPCCSSCAVSLCASGPRGRSDQELAAGKTLANSGQRLVTDGVSDRLSDDAIAQILRDTCPEPHLGPKALLVAALDAGADDNVCALVVYLNRHP